MSSPLFTVTIGHGDQIVARPAVVIHAAWLRESNVRAAIDWFRRQLPARTSLHQLTSSSTRLAKAKWATVERCGEQRQFIRVGDEPGFVAGSCALELDGEGISIALPLSWVARTSEASAAFDDLIVASQPAHAACSFGFNLVWGRAWEQDALGPLLQVALAYPGIDLHVRQSVSGGAVKGAAWLVHLGRHLATRVADDTPRGCARRVLADGVSFTAGDAPVVTASAELRALGALLRPIRMSSWGSAGALFRHRSPHTSVVGFEYRREVDHDPDAWFSRLE